MTQVTAVPTSELRLPIKGTPRLDVPMPAAKPASAPVATRSQLLKEYSEACANMRHYGNARLTRLVMFLALNGGLLNLLFSHQETMPPSLITVTEAAAAFVTILFAIVDHNIVVHFRWFNERARAVEAVIGLQQYTYRQQKRDERPHNIINETHATYLMYITVYGFWIYCIAAL